MKRRLIGVFDSGVGGLSVARHIDSGLPNTSFIYFGDTYYVPYGERSPEEVVSLIDKVSHHLIDSGAEALVMACNTSSALAYDHVVSWSPVPVIGIIKEAAQAAVKATRCGRIGVIANILTASSGAYEKACAEAVLASEAPDRRVEVFPIGCPKLVPIIERGDIYSQEAREALSEYWQPLKEKGVDTIVFGCTHYPFLRHILEEIIGPEVEIIDPAYYVAEHLKRLGFEENASGEEYDGPAQRIYQASGDAEKFSEVAEVLLGRSIGAAQHIDL